MCFGSKNLSNRALKIEFLIYIPQTLTIEGVQKGMAGSVGHTATPMSLATLAVFVRLSSKSSLVDLALGCPGEGHTVIFEFQNGGGGFTGHVVNGILVTQPIRSFDSVIHVPPPVIGFHVAKSGIDAALGGHSVATGGEQFGDDSGLESFLK